MDKSLKQWCDEQNPPLRYEKGWRMYKDNELPNSYQNSKGRIFIKEEPKLLQAQHVTSTDHFKTPEFKFDQLSIASDSSTRNNKGGQSEIPNRFNNIEMGILPTTQTGNNSLSCKDMVTLCQKAYYNVAIMRQIIDLIVDLSIGKLFLKKGNKKSRDFFYSYFDLIGSDQLQEKYYIELWRGSNVFIYPWKKKLKSKDIKKITQIYGSDVSLAKESVILPTKFVFLNPADIRSDGVSSFSNHTYYKVLNSYELACLKKPKTPADENLLNTLPDSIKEQIKKGTSSVTIPLNADDIIISFYKKTDYESFAMPVFFSVLDDINFKIEMKKQDLATLRMMNQSILLFTMGAKPDEGGINYNNINNLQQLLNNSTVARYLVSDYTTKGEFLTPDIGEILGRSKYEVVENDIYIGLNYILLNGEKFANKMTALKIFLAKIRYGQNLFIRDVLKPIMLNISEQLGFKNCPEPYFEYVSIEDDTEFNRLVVRMAEIGHLSPQEALEYFDSGKLPLWEESVENQKEFKKLRDEGLYQPITGNPASQMEILKETQKHTVKMQDKQNEYDDKQKTKDRKHAAENPQSPAPQIVLNAPTKLKQQNGRPAGSKRKKSTNKPRVVGEEDGIDSGLPLFSETKLMGTVKKYGKLESKISELVKQHHNLTELNDVQTNLVLELSKIVARNENPDNWENNDILLEYVKDPIDKNTDRILEIESLAANLSLEPHLATLLFYSKKED